MRGHSFWAKGPDNAGHYNSRPPETGFFCEKGDYNCYYGRFFLQWYAQTLIDHADNVLSLASLAFQGTSIVVKVCVFWSLCTWKARMAIIFPLHRMVLLYSTLSMLLQ